MHILTLELELFVPLKHVGFMSMTKQTYWPVADGICQQTGRPAEINTVEQVDERTIRVECQECGEIWMEEVEPEEKDEA